MSYSKRHNKFLFPALAESIYGSFCKAKNEIANVVNYHPNTLGRAAQGLTAKRVLLSNSSAQDFALAAKSVQAR